MSRLPNTSSEVERSPLTTKSFRRVLASNLVNSAGSAMAPVALAFAVLQDGAGPKSLGLILALNTAPAIFFLLYGGVLADRLSRSALLFWGRVAAGVVQAAVAWAVYMGHTSTFVLGSLGLLAGVTSSISRPASLGIIRQIVPIDLIQQATVMMRVPTNIVRVMGPALGGVLVAVSSPASALAIDAGTYFVSAALLVGLKLPAAMKVASGVWSDVSSGWREVRNRNWFMAYTLYGTVIVAVWRACYELLGPATAQATYGGASSWGFIQSGFAAGLVLGGTVSLRWRPTQVLVVCIAASGGLAIPLLAMGLGAPLFVVIASTFVGSVLLDIAIISWSTVMGQHVPDYLQGRLSGFNSLGEQAGIPVGYLVAAFSLQYLSVQNLMLVGAAAIVIATALNLCVRGSYKITRLSAVSST